jgi:hypothetical protein
MKSPGVWILGSGPAGIPKTAVRPIGLSESLLSLPHPDSYRRKGSQAKRTNIYLNLGAEWWLIVGQLIERRAMGIPNNEKLIAQLTSASKLHDNKIRERLESKAELACRGVESPDRAES